MTAVRCLSVSEHHGKPLTAIFPMHTKGLNLDLDPMPTQINVKIFVDFKRIWD